MFDEIERPWQITTAKDRAGRQWTGIHAPEGESPGPPKCLSADADFGSPPDHAGTREIGDFQSFYCPSCDEWVGLAAVQWVKYGDGLALRHVGCPNELTPP